MLVPVCLHAHIALLRLTDQVHLVAHTHLHTTHASTGRRQGHCDNPCAHTHTYTHAHTRTHTHTHTRTHTHTYIHTHTNIVRSTTPPHHTITPPTLSLQHCTFSPSLRWCVADLTRNQVLAAVDESRLGSTNPTRSAVVDKEGKKNNEDVTKGQEMEKRGWNHEKWKTNRVRGTAANSGTFKEQLPQTTTHRGHVLLFQDARCRCACRQVAVDLPRA